MRVPRGWQRLAYLEWFTIASKASLQHQNEFEYAQLMPLLSAAEKGKGWPRGGSCFFLGMIVRAKVRVEVLGL